MVFSKMELGATRIFLPVVFDTFPKWCARTEVALIKRMEDCRFIIDIKDFYEGPSESVIVTDFAAGDDLFETISAKTFLLTEAVCRVVVGQVLEGVEFLHHSRVLHLDIKHNNIIFNDNNHNSLRIK